MIRICASGLALAVLFSSGLCLPAADEKTSSALADYQQVKSQWDAQLKEMAEGQAKLLAASPPERFAMGQEYNRLLSQIGDTVPKLQAAAKQAYAADNTNREIGDLLYEMAISCLRSDKFEEAQQLADFLIQHKYPNQDVYRIAASAAFPTMHLAEAKKYLEALGGGKPPDDPTTRQLLDEITRYQPLWEKEQKLRAAEAKADDLPRVKLHTSHGDIVLELFENEAPNTVANFISLVEKGFYDGTQFHRVLPDFMAQAGDPLSKDPAKNKGKIGSGGPGYSIADECYEPNHRNHFRGSLSMAHGGRDTGGSQFFLTFIPTAMLDGKHTVFGRVIDGLDVLANLERIDPDQRDRSTNQIVIPDTITKAEVLRKRNHPYEPKTVPKK